jgi:hypothetical protein
MNLLMSMNHRLIHDATHALAIELLKITCFHGSDRTKLYAALYDIVHRGIEEYETKRARMEARLRGARDQTYGIHGTEDHDQEDKSRKGEEGC